MSQTEADSQTTARRPLAGVRVLDLTRLFPGAYCTLLLTRLGAEVIKVEHPVRGDWLRETPPLVDGVGAMFAALNAGKRSLTLDLKDPDAKAALERLVGTAAVLVEGNRPGVLDRLGLGWERMHRLNPRLVLCSITGFGQRGPRAQRVGHDLNYMALAGALSLNGPPNDPQPYGIQVADFAAGGMQAALEITAACLDVFRGGEGTHLDVGMVPGVRDLLLTQRAAATVEGPPQGRGFLTGRYPCYRVYRCKDGHYTVAALEERFWSALCDALEVPDLKERQFAEGDVGVAAHARLEEIFALRTRHELADVFGDLEVCAEPVLTLDEAGLVQVNPAAAPGLGQQTEELLSEAGLGPEEIAGLQARGAA